jgi:uncharacterized protein (DUF433 family)
LVLPAEPAVFIQVFSYGLGRNISLHRQFCGRAEREPIVQSTRVAVHDVIGLLQNGETVDTVKSNCFPQLIRSQIYECLTYYEDHRGEIDLLVARQMAPASE